MEDRERKYQNMLKFKRVSALNAIDKVHSEIAAASSQKLLKSVVNGLRSQEKELMNQLVSIREAENKFNSNMKKKKI